MAKVSAVVPVFNEEKTIAKVVDTLLQSPIISEVICVYDQSSDKSLDILKSFGRRIKLIAHNERMGKGFALAAGVRVAKGEIVIFFDGDLINLSEEHITSLVTPLIEGRTRGALGCHPAKLLDNLISSLIGTRALFREDLLPYLDEMEKARFGVEVLINIKIEDITRVSLHGLRSLHKYEKFPPREAARQLINEGIEIAYEIGRQEKAKLQDFKLLEKIAKTEIKLVPDRVVDFSPLQEKIAKIRNKQVRAFLSEYFNRYLTKAASRFKNRF